MPIITTPGQQGQPLPTQDPTTPVPTRLQTTFAPASPPPAVPPAPQPFVAQPAPTPSTDDFGVDDDDDFETPVATPTAPVKSGVSLSRMSEEDRRKAIIAVFMLVLGKNPADRDFSYYRFSTLTEEGLIKSLLNLPEHKKLVEKANEHTSLKQSVSELDLQVKQLTEAMNSMKQELITMQQLLVEKNRYIQQMRGIPESNMQPTPAVATPSVQPSATFTPAPQPQAQAVPLVQEPTTVLPVKPIPPELPAIETKKLPGPFDELKSMLKGMFTGK